MDALMDMAWLKIVGFVAILKAGLDGLLGPLNMLGPAAAVFLIALLTVAIAKGLTRTIKTRRYAELKKEFQYWYNLRQDALKTADSQKAKLLARNIDQAKLNKAYYDYFFEGFMLSLVTKYLPILSVMAYVSETYSPQNLLNLHGRNYLFKLGSSGDPVLIGSVFWYVVSVLSVYVGWAIIKRFLQKRRAAVQVLEQAV